MVAELVRGLHRVRTRGIAIPGRADPAYAPEPKRVLYVVNRSLPHDVTGYTMRTHGLVRALREAGWDVQPATRVGYPGGHASGTGAHRDEVDGVRYARLAGPDAATTPLDRYVEAAAAVLTEHARGMRPALIHAASNHTNALPALVAARRLGLPFVYEVRGLWEYSSAARIPGWEQTERFALMRDLEGLVAREADLVLTLGEALEAELTARGVEPAKVEIVPNAVDIERFSPRPRDDALARSLGLEHRFVTGFLGSLVGYEGVEDLVDATAELARRGIDAALLVVGEGEAAASIRARAEEQGIAERVRMVGRVAASEVPRYYSLIDVAAFPRLPFRVCELVPPLKPFEAMAMQKPVVAADLPALREVVEHDTTGLLFPSGDATALAERLALLARDPDRAARLAADARAFVDRASTWRAVARTVTGAYADLTRPTPLSTPSTTDHRPKAA